MDITTLNEVELKAMWYDELTKKEQAEANMRVINEEIIKRRKADAQIEIVEEPAEDSNSDDTEIE